MPDTVDLYAALWAEVIDPREIDAIHSDQVRTELEREIQKGAQ